VVAALGASVVAALRRVRGRYPNDRGVAALVEELLAASNQFRELWDTGAVGEHQSERKVVRTEIVGELELDCDVFNVAGTDLHIVAYTAAEGSEAAEKLDFLRVTGGGSNDPGRLTSDLRILHSRTGPVRIKRGQFRAPDKSSTYQSIDGPEQGEGAL
jgi:hypothetical protein